MNASRSISNHFGLALFCLATINPFAHLSLAAPQISGYVYWDLEATGTRDTDDPGIPNIAVSNQLDVVLTDSNGAYDIELPEEGVIFISKPKGYRFRLDDQFLPQFYRVHRPDGSPDLEFAGIPPTGPLPDELNFGLLRGSGQSTIDSIAIGDPQPRDHVELGYFRDTVVNEISRKDTDYIFVLGDMMYDDLSLFGRYNELMKVLATPVINVVGNHDLNLDAHDNQYARETFISHYGPNYYSFSEAGSHFLVLDNIYYMGRDDAGNPRYKGKIDECQVSWIENDLARISPDQTIVILAHIPLYEPNRPDNPALNTENREELLQLLDPFDQVVILAAHVHSISHSYFDETLGRSNPNEAHQILVATASGSWWKGSLNPYGIPQSVQRDGSPRGYHLFAVDNGIYRESYRAVGLPQTYQLRIEEPSAELDIAELEDHNLTVNVFNGSIHSEVEYRLNRGDWTEMNHKPGTKSPFFSQLTERGPYPDWIQPIPSTHIWRSAFPTDLSAGAHLLEVKAEDAAGNRYTQSRIIEIAE